MVLYPALSFCKGQRGTGPVRKAERRENLFPRGNVDHIFNTVRMFMSAPGGVLRSALRQCIPMDNRPPVGRPARVFLRFKRVKQSQRSWKKARYFLQVLAKKACDFADQKEYDCHRKVKAIKVFILSPESRFRLYSGTEQTKVIVTSWSLKGEERQR